MPAKIPPPKIFLRDKFIIKPGLSGQFFEGQKQLLQATHGDLTLVAACGRAPLIEGERIPEKLPAMMHIWKLSDWNVLYDSMYRFSETNWYAQEVDSLKIEHQDLLVGTGHGVETSPRPHQWQSPTNPGYIYLYDEIRIEPSITKLTYLRHLNWFSGVVREWMRLVWIGGEVTGTPSQVCLLWQAGSVEDVEHALARVVYENSTRERFARMMLGIRDLSRQYYYPESTEHFDNRLRAASAALRGQS